MYNTADFVGDNRVIFNIGGNKFRLIVHVPYEYRAVLIKFVALMQTTTGSTRRPCDGCPTAEDRSRL
jgi:RelE-like HigB toxin of type II HigAB toxin-antitoxin system